MIVQTVSGDEGGLGYFGFSYYEQNADALNLVSVDAGEGCVAPSVETIQDESYVLSRPLFMYPSDAAAQKPEVARVPPVHRGQLRDDRNGRADRPDARRGGRGERDQAGRDLRRRLRSGTETQ